MTASSQISGPTGVTAFCSARMKAKYTFSASGYFVSDHDTSQVLKYKKSDSVKKNTAVTVTVIYYLDNTKVLSPSKTFNFKVTARDKCYKPTFTIPVQASQKTVYEGRDQSLTFDKWTVSPSTCAFVYTTVTTSSGGFGTAHANFVFNGASATRTISFVKAKTFTKEQKKLYTIPIKVSYPTSSGTDAGKTFNYKFTVATDPCELASATHTSVASGKASQIMWMELDEASKNTWSKDFTIAGSFKTSNNACTWTYSTVWKTG